MLDEQGGDGRTQISLPARQRKEKASSEPEEQKKEKIPAADAEMKRSVLQSVERNRV